MRKLRSVSVTFALILILILSVFQTAAASQTGGSGALTIDCAAMEVGTPQQQARAQEICASVQGDVSPNDVVYGDCGSFTFWVYNETGGVALFYVHVYSSLAPIDVGYWHANWLNWDRSAGGHADGVIYPDSPGSRAGSSTDEEGTGAGYVTAAVAGGTSQVFLTNGVVCDLAPNSDHVTVTF